LAAPVQEPIQDDEGDKKHQKSPPISLQSH